MLTLSSCTVGALEKAKIFKKIEPDFAFVIAMWVSFSLSAWTFIHAGSV